MKKVTWQDFSHYLFNLRSELGLSQQELARQVGCSRVHLWRLEHNQRHPSKTLLRMLAQLDQTCSKEALLMAFEVMIEYRCEEYEFG